MTYRGRVRNGVIVLDEPAALPEGAEVDVTPARNGAEEKAPQTEEELAQPTWAEVFKDIAGKAEGLPPDMARNHDHYLHGAPKR